MSSASSLDDVSAHVDLVVEGRNLTEAAPAEPVLPLLRNLLRVWAVGGAFRFMNAPVTVTVAVGPAGHRSVDIVVGTDGAVHIGSLRADWLQQLLHEHLEAASLLGEADLATLPAPAAESLREHRGDEPASGPQGAPTLNFELPESAPLFRFAAELSWRRAIRTPLEQSSRLPVQAHIAPDDRLWVGRLSPELATALLRAAEGVVRSGAENVDGPAGVTPLSSWFQLSTDSAVGATDDGDGGVLLVAASGATSTHATSAAPMATPFFRRGSAAHIITSGWGEGAVLHHWHPTAGEWKSVNLQRTISGPVRHGAWCGDYLVIVGDEAAEVLRYDGHTLSPQWRVDRPCVGVATQYLVPGLVALVAEDELVLASAHSGKVRARLPRFWWTFEFGGIDRRGALHIVERSESGRLDHLRMPPETLLALVA